MKLFTNGIYSTRENKIIIILNYFEDTNEYLYLEIDEKLVTNNNKGVNEYYSNLKQTNPKGFCKYCKRKPLKYVEDLVDGYLGQLANESETDDNSVKEL